MYDILVSMLQSNNLTKDVIVDQLFCFLSSEERFWTAYRWVKMSTIYIRGQAVYHLRPRQKYEFLKSFFKSRHFYQEKKLDLMQIVLGNDISILAEKIRAACLSSLPIPEVKARIWQEIIDPNTQDSHVQRNAKMAEFYSNNQLDLVKPYFAKFFDEIVRQRDHQQFQLFVTCLLPVIDANLSHWRRLEQISMSFPNEDDFEFQEVLQDGLTRLQIAYQIRQEAAQQL